MNNLLINLFNKFQCELLLSKKINEIFYFLVNFLALVVYGLQKFILNNFILFFLIFNRSYYIEFL